MRVWLAGVAILAVAACSGGGQGSGSTGAPNPVTPTPIAAPDAGSPADAGSVADAGGPITPPAADAGTTPDAGPTGGGSAPDAGTGFAIIEIPQVVGASGGTFVPLPAGINNLGQVVGGFNDCVSVGLSECNGGPLSGFIFDPVTGTTTRISASGTENHTALGINDAGTIILNGNPRGLFDGLVLRNGAVTHLGDEAIAFGINAAGQVSGSTQTANGNQIAFLWDGKTVNAIGPAGSLGSGLNNAGVVVGAINVDKNLHAAAFTAAGAQDLGGLPDAQQTIAMAVNESGRVVGRSFVGTNFVEHGFVFDLPNGPMVDVTPNGSSSLVSVNAAGDAVGTLLDRTGEDGAILWHNGAVVDLTSALGDANWRLVSAAAINDKGQITGFGLHNGKQAAYVLTPK
jgi:probable HAF family extracellular repeat protein